MAIAETTFKISGKVTGTKDIKDLTSNLKELEDSMHGTGQSFKLSSKYFKALGDSTGDAEPKITKTTYAMTNFGRVIQDAPYGMMAIANNLEGMVQGFLAVKKEAGSSKGAFKALAKGLSGPGGLMLGISLVSAAFSILPGILRKNKKETEELGKSFDKINNIIKKLERSNTGLKRSMYDTAKSFNVAKNASADLIFQLQKLQKIQAEEVLERFEKNGISTFKNIKGEAGKIIKEVGDIYRAGFFGMARATDYLTDKFNKFVTTSRGMTKIGLSKEFKQLVLSAKKTGKEFNSLSFLVNTFGIDVAKVGQTPIGLTFLQDWTKQFNAAKNHILEQDKVITKQIGKPKKVKIKIKKPKKVKIKIEKPKIEKINLDNLKDSFSEISALYELHKQKTMTINETPTVFDTMASSAQDFFKLNETSMETMKNIGDSTQSILSGAFGGIKTGMEDAVGAVIKGEAGFGQAMKKMTQVAVFQLATRSVVEGLFQIAEGIAALASARSSKAAMHFKAAAVFGAVGVAAGVASRAIGIPSSGTDSSKDGGGKTTENTTTQTQTINIYGDIDAQNLEKIKQNQENINAQLQEAQNV